MDMRSGVKGTYRSAHHQATINAPEKRPTQAKDFAPYTGLPRKAARQWARNPEQYIHGLMQQTLDAVAAVNTPTTTAQVTPLNKARAALEAGTLGYSVSFLPAKVCVNLFGWLAAVFPEHAPRLFLAGAAGYNLLASILHPTSTKIVAGSLAANHGGPQPLDKAALDNAITLWCMALVRRADGQDDSDIQQAIQEIADAVLARAGTEAQKGRPLPFDSRQHPILGAAARTWGFHASFFSFSLMYCLAGGLTPLERQSFIDAPGSVALRAGLFNLTDALVWMVCGEIAGIMTLAGHLFTNATVQHGPDKPGLNQTWPEELEAALEKLEFIVSLHSELIRLRNTIRRNILASPVGEEEKKRRTKVFREKVLPLLDEAIDQVEALQTKYEERARLLSTEEGRWELSKKKIGAMVLKGAGKTPHKLINSAPHALRMRTASEIGGNMLSLLMFSYAILHMYTLFSTTMPFRETDMNGTVPRNDSGLNDSDPAVFNGTATGSDIPLETQVFSTLLGVILIAAFSTRAAFIPLVEVLLNAIYAGGLRGARKLGLRGENAADASTGDRLSATDDDPPSPDHQAEGPPETSFPNVQAVESNEDPIEVVDDDWSSGSDPADWSAAQQRHRVPAHTLTQLEAIIRMVEDMTST